VHHAALHRLSIDEYHRLIDAGGLDEDARIELLGGLLVDIGPKTPQHENVVAFLADWLRDHIDRSRHQVRVSSPLTIGTSEPEPDLAIITAPSPRGAHPGTALLVIEVAHSSLRRELDEKPALYAQAGVHEYWVVDLDGNRCVCHADPHDGYREITVHGADASLPGAGVGLPPLIVADVLGAAGL